MVLGILLFAVVGSFVSPMIVAFFMGTIPVTQLLKKPGYSKPMKKVGIVGSIITAVITAITIGIIVL